jgi:hypothetical protein
MSLLLVSKIINIPYERQMEVDIKVFSDGSICYMTITQRIKRKNSVVYANFFEYLELFLI